MWLPRYSLTRSLIKSTKLSRFFCVAAEKKADVVLPYSVTRKQMEEVNLPNPRIDDVNKMLLDRPYQSFWEKMFSIKSDSQMYHIWMHHAFQCCMNSALDRAWYAGTIDTSFHQFQILLSLHIWMLNAAIVPNQDLGPILSQNLFDVLWIDTEARVRSIPSVKRIFVDSTVREIQNYVYSLCMELDTAMKQKSFEDVVTSTALIIDKRLVQPRLYTSPSTTPNRPHTDSNILAEYFLNEFESVKALPQPAVITGRFRFSPPPADISKIPDKSSIYDETGLFRNDLKEGWKVTYSRLGSIYYWNEKGGDEEDERQVSVEAPLRVEVKKEQTVEKSDS